MTEFELQKAICTWVKLQYSDIIFWSDMSGIRLPIGLATKIKSLKCGRGIPDMFFANKNNGTIYSGLFLELKRESPFLKNGELSKEKHIQEQHKMHVRLIECGYKCYFVWTFEQAKMIINDYYNVNKNLK